MLLFLRFNMPFIALDILSSNTLRYVYHVLTHFLPLSDQINSHNKQFHNKVTAPLDLRH